MFERYRPVLLDIDIHSITCYTLSSFGSYRIGFHIPRESRRERSKTCRKGMKPFMQTQ